MSKPASAPVAPVTPQPAPSAPVAPVTPQPAPSAPPARQPEVVMTAAAAAELVGIPADEVLAFRDTGEEVIVVTIAGQKLRWPAGEDEA